MFCPNKHVIGQCFEQIAMVHTAGRFESNKAALIG